MYIPSRFGRERVIKIVVRVMGSISIPCYEEGENDSLDSSECLFCPHCDCKIRDDGRNADIHFCPDCEDEVYIKH